MRVRKELGCSCRVRVWGRRVNPQKVLVKRGQGSVRLTTNVGTMGPRGTPSTLRDVRVPTPLPHDPTPLQDPRSLLLPGDGEVSRKPLPSRTLRSRHPGRVTGTSSVSWGPGVKGVPEVGLCCKERVPVPLIPPFSERNLRVPLSHRNKGTPGSSGRAVRRRVVTATVLGIAASSDGGGQGRVSHPPSRGPLGTHPLSHRGSPLRVDRQSVLRPLGGSFGGWVEARGLGHFWPDDFGAGGPTRRVRWERTHVRSLSVAPFPDTASEGMGVGRVTFQSLSCLCSLGRGGGGARPGPRPRGRRAGLVGASGVGVAHEWCKRRSRGAGVGVRAASPAVRRHCPRCEGWTLL